MKKCPICEKGKLEAGKVKEEMYGVDLGEYAAEICSSCGESFLDAEAMKQIEQKAKEKGIWGIGKQIKIVKSGNSLAVRIPKAIVEFAKLREGMDAFIYPEDHKLIVEARKE